MSQVIIPYTDDGGTKYGVSVELSQESLLNDYCAAKSVSRTAPYGVAYATLAALQAVSGWSSAIAQPAGLSTRKLTFNLLDDKTSAPTGASFGALGNTAVTVGDTATFNAIYPTGATPYPETPATLTAAQAQVASAQGEQRLSN